MEKAKDYKKYLKTLKKITKPKGMDDLTRSRVGEFTVAGRIKKLLKRKRGGDTPGLKNYVKKSDRIKKILKVLDSKTGKETFVSRNEIMTSGDRYKPVKGGVRNYVSELARQNQKRTGGAMLKNPGKADLDKDGKLSGYEKKRGMAIEKSMSGKRFGGVMKRSKGGGADSGRVGEMRSKLGVAINKIKRSGAMGRRTKPKLQAPERKPMKPLAKKMGGGMMNKPMGYKKGTMIMARGCKLGRKKATKIT